MNVVDSSGWLEFFAAGPNAGFFAPALGDTDKLVVPTISILEVFRRVCQQRDEQSALTAVAAMQQGNVVDLDVETALAAGRLGLDLRLPLADSVRLASARAHGATLWTQDADFEGIDGVRYLKRKKG